MSTSVPEPASDRLAAGGSPGQSPESQVLLDVRLDAIDQALLGLLPRSERVELVAKIEARIHERLAGGDEAAVESLRTPAAALMTGALANLPASRTRKKRSGVAIVSGIAGLASLALLFLLPVIYIVFTMGADLFDETIMVRTIGSAHLLVFLAGSVAVMCGIVGLVKLSRHSERLRGHGWAITGLCCGPLPVLVGGLPLLLIALPMALSAAFVTHTASPPVTVTASAGPYPSPAGCSTGTCMPPSPAAGPYTYAAAPAGLPLPAAPSYYPSDTAPFPPAPFAPPVTPAAAPPLPIAPATVGPPSPKGLPTNAEATEDKTSAADDAPAVDQPKADETTTADDTAKADDQAKPSEDASSKNQNEVESD